MNQELKDITDESYRIESVEPPEWSIIGPALHAYNIQQAGDDQGQSLCFVLRAADKEIAGGVIGATHWNWLHIDLMWVKEELRGRGYGHRLLMLAEEEARKRGQSMLIWTPLVFRRQIFISNMATVYLANCPTFRPVTGVTI